MKPLRIFYILLLFIACAKKPTDDATSGSGGSSSGRYLYVSSGFCQAGPGITTFATTTSSNQILKINTSTGNRDAILADYWSVGAAPGTDSPVGVVNWDANNLLVLVLSGTTGRIEYVPKTYSGGTARAVFNLSPSNATVIASAPRELRKSFDGSGLFIVRTNAVEKVTSVGSRVGTTPFVSNNLGATCGTNSNYYDLAQSVSGKLLVTHGAASPNNRTVSVPASGATGTCLAAQAQPVTTSYPVAIVYDRTNHKAIVASSGNGVAVNVNTIIVYDYDETAGTFSNAQKIYDAFDYPATYSYLLYAIPTMLLDETEGMLYVATANMNSSNLTTGGGNYMIEKFKYTPSLLGTSNSSVLTRQTFNNGPFYSYGVDTKCISGMAIDN